jgi:hypothetical protein
MGAGSLAQIIAQILFLDPHNCGDFFAIYLFTTFISVTHRTVNEKNNKEASAGHQVVSLGKFPGANGDDLERAVDLLGQ